ncbi:MAG: divergent polysaccharide deacetylase family protein [Candidatus Caldatribacteriota bacterium]|nr:divergent polysaccharide deacetylase family protein [Candidatus Caldatribacteriota bacterium]
MKKNNRLIINLMAILIILTVSIGVSDLLSKSYRNKVSSLNGQLAFVSASDEEEPEVIEYTSEPEETIDIYESEKKVDFIIKDIASSEAEEETNYSPRIAFIIDDFGYEKGVAEKMMDLDFPVTLSILPFLQYSKEIAEEGYKKNQEIMLHLPMEAKNSSANPGPGAIRSYMSEEDIRKTVRDCIDSVPCISGMNNHMGSKITEDERIMKFIFEELKKNDLGLYFVDSKTSLNSIAYDLALEMGINSIERTVFLDNEEDMDYIKGQLLEAKELAFKKGKVVAIGHDRINTYYVLKRMVPELIKEGIEIVFVSTLVSNDQ